MLDEDQTYNGGNEVQIAVVQAIWLRQVVQMAVVQAMQAWLRRELLQARQPAQQAIRVREVAKLTLEAEKGATFQVGSTGAKVNINDKGISLTPQGANSTGGSSGADPSDSPSITIKAGAKPADQNSLESFEKDQGPSIAFSTKDTDGKKIGSGKITGLADIKEGEKDGTIAVNKNYVDGKVEDLNNNRPFDFYLDKEKVVKDKDGNFHKADKPTEKLSADDMKKVVIKAEPSTAPIGISNVASGLGNERFFRESRKIC
ncbi:hypothetical protein [Histophilus somni]|uniref:hypothetical protein n=1 Tax=Histophilus somni TaxID=731 RepID=UPI0018EAF5BC|nr:hypothetical protein [Histophilus somni]QQF83770.1 hypothetical protein JFL54_07240 [Histophilus somni]